MAEEIPRVILGITSTVRNPLDSIVNFLTSEPVDIIEQKKKLVLPSELIINPFNHVSLSEIVREESEKNRDSDAYEQLRDTANSLREKHGRDYLASEIVMRHAKVFDEASPILITDIKNYKEIEFLKKKFGNEFYLVAIDSSIDTRWDIIRERPKPTDPKSKRELQKWDAESRGTVRFINDLEKQAEYDGKKLDRQHVEKCISRADAMLYYTRDTDAALTFFADLYGLTSHQTSRRPTRDEAFMHQAYGVAKLSTCLTRQVGAILAKDNHMLIDGYNGAPSGDRHCIDIGNCEKDKNGKKRDEGRDKCKGVHAEENIFLHAAKRGTKVEGATMYVTTAPCSACSPRIKQTGISNVIYAEAYSNTTERILEPKVSVRRFQGITHHAYARIFDMVFQNRAIRYAEKNGK